jgi:hypothetical protein
MAFRLLTETPIDHTGPSFELESHQWSITEPFDILSDTCVSYVWGTGRAPNPMSSEIMMSDHTLSALRTVLRNHPCREI